MKRYSCVAVALAIASLTPFGAHADDYYCQGTADGYYDNVYVPYGYTCTLKGAKVHGNVEIEKGGALRTEYGTEIYGDIQGYGAKWIKIKGKTYVGGNVQLERTRYPSKICDSRIKGDVQLFDNYGPFEIGCKSGNYIGENLQVEDNDVRKDFDLRYMYNITRNYVGGDLQFNENKSKYGNFWIYRNKIKGNLQCYGNYPRPKGGKNRVYGDAEDQCYRLAGRY